MGGCKANLDKLVYPVYVSIKGDGIRTNIYEGLCRTKSLKPLPNIHTRNLLESYPVLEKLEAELVTTGNLEDPESFNKATSAFMRHKEAPELFMWVFDKILEGIPFYERYAGLQSLKLPKFARILPQTLIGSRKQLDKELARILASGYEGAIIRQHDSLYKFGKATISGGQLLKYKPFEDDEAIVEGIYEGQHNTNAKVTNELGRSKRSSSKDGMVPSGIAGGILGRHPTWGIIRVSGLKDDLAKDMFDNFENYKGRLFTFRYQDHGTMDAPRIAKFKGFRSKDDISLKEEE